jgi:hypothetical protein
MKRVIDAEGYPVSFEELELVIQSCIRRTLYPSSIIQPKRVNLIPLSKACNILGVNKYRFSDKAEKVGITPFIVNGKSYFSEFQLQKYLEAVKAYPYLKKRF